MRHAARYNSQLDVERALERTAGENWMAQALQRDHWRELALIFVEQHDVPWATGQQPALTNLASNKRAPQRSRQPALRHE